MWSKPERYSVLKVFTNDKTILLQRKRVKRLIAKKIICCITYANNKKCISAVIPKEFSGKIVINKFANAYTNHRYSLYLHSEHM
jgi:choline kinase